MEKIIVKNGLVFDPINNIEGEIKDILIENGQIVEKFSSESEVKKIDAKGKTVIPAALDIHAHIASQQINWARLLGAKNDTFQKAWNGLTLENIARAYISNGYTFVLEANVFPSLAKQTIFNFTNLPTLDKAMLLNASNLWPLELEFQKEKVEDMAVFLSDLLLKTKGFGIKAYNPFEAEDWHFKVLRSDLSQQGRLYNFSALSVYETLTKCVEHLGLPHSIHAHIEGYEQEKGKANLNLILNAIKNLNLKASPKTNLKVQRSQIFHLAHANAYNPNGDNSELIHFLNENSNFDADLGFIGFSPINPLITSDRRLINSIPNLLDINSLQPLIRSAVECEGDSFVTLRTFDKQDKASCILWANAIDLALNTKNKWQLQFSVNYPNYANISRVPEIATWLLSKMARDRYMSEMNTEFLKENSLINDDKTLSFNNFVLLTRASPAKSLGLGNIKGNLGAGSDADLNILDIDITKIDLNNQYNLLQKSLVDIEYVVKSGIIIKLREMLNLDAPGKVFWAEGKVVKEDKSLIMARKKDYYQKFYSIFYDSLKTSLNDKFLRKIE